jgi:metallo-beta-lactamase family protein
MKHDTIIIASSGMMTGGRVLHHLINRLPDPNNVIMISGYQAEGSRGRKLQDGADSIRIYGKDVPVRAKVFNIKGLSGHADRNELLAWLDGFQQPPAMTFVVHGEKRSAGALCDTLKNKGWNAHVPHYLETIELFNQF